MTGERDKPGRLRIRHVDPKALTPAPYNDEVRTMTVGARAKLRASLEVFGFVEPILVNTRTGWIVGGHRRTEVAIEMGLEVVPVVERDLDPEQEKALSILLNNREAQGDFDPAGLLATLATFEDTPLLELAGFDYDQYQALQLAQAAATKTGREGYTPPLPESPKTKVGQVWALGDEHILVVGDATDPDAYTAMPEKAEMCFTDPPYGIDYEKKIKSNPIRGSRIRASSVISGDSADSAEALLSGALPLVAEHTAGAIYCCSVIGVLPVVVSAWRAAGIHHSTTIAWVKHRINPTLGNYQPQWEAILYGWPEGQSHHWIGVTNASNVWHHQRPAASRLHPTMKPVLLIEHALRNSSHPGGLVLDPFAGSGSTMVAAENTGRSSFSVELDPRYADVILARYESLETGQPTLKTTGPK